MAHTRLTVSYGIPVVRHVLEAAFDYGFGLVRGTVQPGSVAPLNMQTLACAPRRPAEISTGG